MKKYIFLIFSIFSLLKSEIGETSARFLLLGISARESGMGGIGIALATPVTSSHFNPSLSAQFDLPQVIFTHTEHFQGIRSEYISYFFPSNYGNFSFSLKTFYLSNLEKREGPTPYPIRTFRASSFCPGISFSKSLNEYFSAGTNLKFIYSTIDVYNAFSSALDLGTSYYIPGYGLKIGLSLSDIGMPLRYKEESSPLPTRIGIGIGYENPFLGAEFDILKFLKEKFELRVGIEGNIREILFPRIGYRTGYEELGGLTGISFGIGIRLRNIDLDYAFLPFDFLGNVHKISFVYTFGKYEKEREKEIAMEIEEKAKITSQTFLKLGDEFFGKRDYENAIKNYELSLIWDPYNLEAKRKLNETKDVLRKQEIDKTLKEGIELYKKGEYIEAMIVFGKIISKYPENELAKKWFDAASKASAEKAGKVKEEAKKYFRKGIYYLSRDDFASAKKNFLKALKISPDYQDAKYYLNRIDEIKEKRFLNYIKKFENLLSEEKWREAEKMLIKARKILPTDKRLKNAEIKLNGYKKKESDKLIEEAKTLIRKKKYGDAKLLLKSALKIYPKSKRARELLAKVEKEKAPKESIEDLYIKGINAYVRGQFEMAILYWEKVLEIDPEHERAKRNLERAQAKLKYR